MHGGGHDFLPDTVSGNNCDRKLLHKAACEGFSADGDVVNHFLRVFANGTSEGFPRNVGTGVSIRDSARGTHYGAHPVVMETGGGAVRASALRSVSGNQDQGLRQQCS